MAVRIQVPLPPYIVKDPRSYDSYRSSSRSRYLNALGCFRNIKSQPIDATIRHILYVNDWQPMVFTDPHTWV